MSLLIKTVAEDNILKADIGDLSVSLMSTPKGNVITEVSVQKRIPSPISFTSADDNGKKCIADMEKHIYDLQIRINSLKNAVAWIKANYNKFLASTF